MTPYASGKRWTAEDVDVDRFWARVDRTGDGCWEWTRGRFTTGYGAFKVKDQLVGAHRVAFVLGGGELAPGMCVCHRCDNPACCNPAHLWQGTVRANNEDRERKGRGVRAHGDAHGSRTRPETRARGERNGAAVLTRELVLVARRRRAGGETVGSIAASLGVLRETLGAAIRGATWSHVKDGQ